MPAARVVLCSHPVIETQWIGGRSFARCLSCTQISPPDQDANGEWAESHRSAARGLRGSAHLLTHDVAGVA